MYSEIHDNAQSRPEHLRPCSAMFAAGIRCDPRAVRQFGCEEVPAGGGKTMGWERS